jgi:hypothetical protein
MIAATGSVLAALSGCLGSSEDGSDSGTPDDEPTVSETPATPAYATCEEGSVEPSAPAVARELPDAFTHDKIVEYVTAVERAFVLPSGADGYVKIGTVTTESVARGHLAHVPVNGGYYNEPSDGNTTETTHYDLGTHRTSYFLTERVARRAKSRDGTADPREEGDVVACRPG